MENSINLARLPFASLVKLGLFANLGLFLSAGTLIGAAGLFGFDAVKFQDVNVYGVLALIVAVLGSMIFALFGTMLFLIGASVAKFTVWILDRINTLIKSKLKKGAE